MLFWDLHEAFTWLAHNSTAHDASTADDASTGSEMSISVQHGKSYNGWH